MRAPPAARRVWGMVYRHLALYRRSWPRLLELAYWPTFQMLIWGFTASFFASRMGMAVSFLEEIWSRNLGHVFVSPLRPWELVAALICMSVLRMLAGVVPAVLLAWLLYAFDLFAPGPVIVLFVANLMVMGWSVALGVVSLILRHGAGAESLAWTVLFGLTPFSAVFYPVAVLRAAIGQGVIAWDHLAWAAGLNAAWLAVACLVFTHQFSAARRTGALLNIGE